MTKSEYENRHKILVLEDRIKALEEANHRLDEENQELLNDVIPEKTNIIDNLPANSAIININGIPTKMTVYSYNIETAYPQPIYDFGRLNIVEYTAGPLRRIIKLEGIID